MPAFYFCIILKIALQLKILHYLWWRIMVCQKTIINRSFSFCFFAGSWWKLMKIKISKVSSRKLKTRCKSKLLKILVCPQWYSKIVKIDGPLSVRFTKFLLFLFFFFCRIIHSSVRVESTRGSLVERSLASKFPVKFTIPWLALAVCMAQSLRFIRRVHCDVTLMEPWKRSCTGRPLIWGLC